MGFRVILAVQCSTGEKGLNGFTRSVFHEFWQIGGQDWQAGNALTASVPRGQSHTYFF